MFLNSRDFPRKKLTKNSHAIAINVKIKQTRGPGFFVILKYFIFFYLRQHHESNNYYYIARLSNTVFLS